MKYFNCVNLKKGFTLAEVLITLVIIGVIAAMTVPTIIQNANESATVSKVKKGLSFVAQAKILAETQNGPITDWDYPDGNTEAATIQFWNYLRPYISVAQDCGSATNCYQTDGIYKLNGTLHANHGSTSNYYKFVLSDGGVMWFRTATTGKCSNADLGVNNVCAVFFYDVNGDKQPNTMGRDIFLYVINPDGVFPVMRNDCAKTANGWGCAAYIIKNSNMNYLH